MNRKLILSVAAILLACIIGAEWHRARKGAAIRRAMLDAQEYRLLADVCTSIITDAKAHDGKLRSSEDEYIDEGIWEERSSIVIDDDHALVRKYMFRPIPSLDYSGELIVLVQWHDPPSRFICTCQLDGQALAWSTIELPRVLEEDNTLREKNGLAPFN